MDGARPEDINSPDNLVLLCAACHKLIDDRPDDYPLLWPTFNEAMKIIGPAYQEALDRIVARVEKVELTVENQALWSFIEQAGRWPAVRYGG
jgi:hypothetical protein